MKSNSERGSGFLKFFDIYLGIPTVYIFGLFKLKKQRRPDTKEIKKVAFLKTAAIGDTVLLSALVRDLKKVLSSVHLTLFTGSSNNDIAQEIPDVDEVIRLPVRNPLKAVKITRGRGNFDIWCDFGSWPRLNAVITFLSKAGYKIGFKTEKQYRHYIYDFYIEHSSELHEVENYKAILRHLNISGSSRPLLNSKASFDFGNIITLHMFPGGSRAFLKEWPESSWIELIKILTASGYRIYLTGAEADMDRALNIREKAGCEDSVYIVAGEYNLNETLALLKSSMLVISVDTGIMHMASALNCNLISLHGPTSERRWGALNENSESIRCEMKCSPCLNLGFDSSCTKNICMNHITVEEVLVSVRKFIDV